MIGRVHLKFGAKNYAHIHTDEPAQLWYLESGVPTIAAIAARNNGYVWLA